MTLPEASEGRFPLLKPGKYTFRITDLPEKRRRGQATAIIIKFTAIDEFGEPHDSSIMMFPFPDRETGYYPYKTLKDEIIKSDEEVDWVGKSFLGEIEIGPHPTKENQEIQRIVNIKPLPKATGPIGEEDTTPPPEEEDDPGPKDPGEDEDVPF